MAEGELITKLPGRPALDCAAPTRNSISALTGALCAQRRDLPGLLAAIGTLRSSGWIATALTVAHLARLAFEDPQLLVVEAGLWPPTNQ